MCSLGLESFGNLVFYIQLHYLEMFWGLNLCINLPSINWNIFYVLFAVKISHV